MNWNLAKFLPEAGACQTNFNVSLPSKKPVMILAGLHCAATHSALSFSLLQMIIAGYILALHRHLCEETQRSTPGSTPVRRRGNPLSQTQVGPGLSLMLYATCSVGLLWLQYWWCVTENYAFLTNSSWIYVFVCSFLALVRGYRKTCWPAPAPCTLSLAPATFQYWDTHCCTLPCSTALPCHFLHLLVFIFQPLLQKLGNPCFVKMSNQCCAQLAHAN